LIYSNWPEYNELKLLRSVLQSNDLVIDVGAYVGHISLLLSDLVRPENIVAFEPDPYSFRRLVENWTLNGWPSDKLYRLAVGATAGTVFLRDEKKPSTTQKISEMRTNEKSIEVPLAALDDFRHLWQKQRIGLLKIDVEGYEKEVFLGGRQLLAHDRPRVIMFESLSHKLDHEIASLFKEWSYEVFQLDSEGRPGFEGNSAQNIFASPVEIADENCSYHFAAFSSG
jgi:FkbM family methyltransferase